jgi:hypothetical protein
MIIHINSFVFPLKFKFNLFNRIYQIRFYSQSKLGIIAVINDKMDGLFIKRYQRIIIIENPIIKGMSEIITPFDVT